MKWASAARVCRRCRWTDVLADLSRRLSRATVRRSFSALGRWVASLRRRRVINRPYGGDGGASTGSTSPASRPAIGSLRHVRHAYVEGWRVWQVVLTPDGVRLASLRDGSVWPVRLRRRAEVRSSGSTLSGLYAFRTLSALLREFRVGYGVIRPGDIPAHVLSVAGRVALWGRIVEYEYGWRAEFAYPQVLYAVDLPDDVRALLSRSYGIEVYRATADGLRAMADREAAAV